MNAIGALGRAFANCNKAGVCIFGMDANLLAYDYAKIKELCDDGRSYYEAQRELGEYEQVNDHRVYLDSGGW